MSLTHEIRFAQSIETNSRITKKGRFDNSKKERLPWRRKIHRSLHIGSFWKIHFINPPEVQGEVVMLHIHGKYNDDAKVSKSSIWVNRKIAECRPLSAPGRNSREDVVSQVAFQSLPPLPLSFPYHFGKAFLSALLIIKSAGKSHSLGFSLRYFATIEHT